MDLTASGHPVIPVTDYDDQESFPDEFLTYYTEELPFDEAAGESLSTLRKGLKKRLTRVTSSLGEVYQSEATTTTDSTATTANTTTTTAKSTATTADTTTSTTNPTTTTPATTASRRRRRIMEIFTWTCNVTTVAKEFQWEGSEPGSIETGYDLSTEDGRKAAWQYYRDFDPDVVVIAFPCDPWSKMQNMNMGNPVTKAKIMAKRTLHRHILHWVRAVVERQMKYDKFYVVENPSGSAAWSEPPMRMVRRASLKVIVHMCTQGLRDPWTSQLLRKSTLLVHELALRDRQVPERQVSLGMPA